MLERSAKTQGEYLKNLTERVKSGDTQAFGLIYQETRPDLIQFLQSKGYGPDSPIEDIVQETYIVGMRKIKDLDDGYDVKPWLYAIARKIASSQRRLAYNRKKREIPNYETKQFIMEGSRGLTEEEPEDLEELLARREASNKYEKILESLPENQRDVLELIGMGFSNAEVARLLDITVGTVRSRLRSAKKMCKAKKKTYELKELLSY